MDSDDKSIPAPDLEVAKLIVHFINGYFGLGSGEDEALLKELDDIRARLMAQEVLSPEEQQKLSDANAKHINFDLLWEDESGELVSSVRLRKGKSPGLAVRRRDRW